MTNNRNLNLVRTLFEYAFVILMLCNFFCVYFGYNNPTTNVLFYVWQIMLFIMGGMSIELLIKNNKKLYEKFLIFLTILIPLFVIFWIVNILNYGFPINFYFLYFVDPILLVAYFIEQSNKGKLYNLVFKFENIMLVLSIFSLIGWLLFTFGFKPNTYIQYIWDNLVSKPGFFFVDFSAQKTTEFLFWNNFTRNTGLFTEAPIYSHFLCMAFFIDIFIRTNKNKYNYRSFILALTIFTTSSTTGIIFLLSSLFYKYILSIKKIGIRIMIFCLIPALIFAIELILTIKRGDNSIYSSYGIRINDVYAGLSAWKNHLVIGNGIGNLSSITKYLYEYRIQDNNIYISNGLLTLLAYGGIIYSLYYIIPVLLAFRHSMKLLGFAIFSFALLYFETFQDITFTIFIFSFILAAAILRRDYEK